MVCHKIQVYVESLIAAQWQFICWEPLCVHEWMDEPFEHASEDMKPDIGNTPEDVNVNDYAESE